MEDNWMHSGQGKRLDDYSLKEVAENLQKRMMRLAREAARRVGNAPLMAPGEARAALQEAADLMTKASALQDIIGSV